MKKINEFEGILHEPTNVICVKCKYWQWVGHCEKNEENQWVCKDKNDCLKGGENQDENDWI